MVEATLKIHIDLAGIAGRVQRLLKQVNYMASIGVRQAEEISEASLEMPELSLVHQYDHTNPWTVAEAQLAWRRWVLTNAFRDIAEVIAGTLEEVQHVLAVWSVLKSSEPSTQVAAEKWNKAVAARSEQFHRRTLPQKLDFLASEYSFNLPTDLVAEITSINASRNCFVHRGGAVSKLDADTTGSLVLRWRQLTPIAIVDGVEKELVLPYVTEAETQIGVKVQSMAKSFAPGEQLEVSLQDFSGICWTLFTFAQGCGQDLEQYGRAKGFQFKAPAV